MYKADEQITRAYFRMEEAQRERLRLERLLHPELLKFKKGGPPPKTDVKRIRIEELAKLGLDEDRYQRMLLAEEEAKAELCELAELHVLWPHFEKIKGLSKYTCGAFIAAAGDITRCPTVSSFWKGMGLDVLPDGTVPRKVRGAKGEDVRKVPCLPHVSKIGEQIRQQMLRSGGRLRGFYDRFRAREDEFHPDKAKMFKHKSALRLTQKLLYGALWREYRLGYGLTAPMPYAFDLLKHDEDHLVTIQDLYDDRTAEGD